MWMWSVCPAACQIVRNPAAWTSATLVGTVFAHRVFDLVPVILLILFVALTAEVPNSATLGLIGFVVLGVVLLVLAFLSAKHHHRSRR